MALFNNVLETLKDFFTDPFLYEVVLRFVLSVVMGGLIGSERARHGRAAGIRTHILVCLGSALTSMTSIYISEIMGHGGDILRISAQVISGIGFLGAGMIILKPNNVITGLTTAAGVWTTAVIGIALGYGFYLGAVVVTILFLGTIILFAKFERHKKATEVIYLEIDDMYQTNRIMKELTEKIGTDFAHHIHSAKSHKDGHLGINIVIDKRINFDVSTLCDIDGVVFAIEE